ncbi:GNAT family N-acetyltransferase [Candidatus Woesearchaeota archaeon]|nr:GNAT family N-acetyltransferase [Candidatus Woesearchaeota archaeon]
MNSLIRTADPCDAPRIIALQREAGVGRTNPQWPSTGFVNYKIPTLGEYVRRIFQNPFFYVTEVDLDTIGFLAAYDFERFKTLGDPILENLTPHVSHATIYADQILVKAPYRGNFVGRELVEKLVADSLRAGKEEVVLFTSHHPRRNEQAISLVQNFGFQELSDFAHENARYGLYKKMLKDS